MAPGANAGKLRPPTHQPTAKTLQSNLRQPRSHGAAPTDAKPGETTSPGFVVLGMTRRAWAVAAEAGGPAGFQLQQI